MVRNFTLRKSKLAKVAPEEISEFAATDHEGTQYMDDEGQILN